MAITIEEVKARKAAKLSQKNLGIAAGMDEFSASAHMNHYEKERHTPTTLLFNTSSRHWKSLPRIFAESDELAELVKIISKLEKSKRTELIKNPLSA